MLISKKLVGCLNYWVLFKNVFLFLLLLLLFLFFLSWLVFLKVWFSLRKNVLVLVLRWPVCLKTCCWAHALFETVILMGSRFIGSNSFTQCWIYYSNLNKNVYICSVVCVVFLGFYLSWWGCIIVLQKIIWKVWHQNLFFLHKNPVKLGRSKIL